jgi:hypothetical protein
MKHKTVHACEGWINTVVLCMILLPLAGDVYAYPDSEIQSSVIAERKHSSESSGSSSTEQILTSRLAIPANPVHWEVEFFTRQVKPGVLPITATDRLPGYFVQRGKLRNGTYSLLAEMGNIELSGLHGPITPLPHKGVKLQLGTSAPGNSITLEVFTAKSAQLPDVIAAGQKSAHETLLIGTTGVFSFLSEKTIIRTSFLTVRDTPDVPAKSGMAKTGNAAGISARVDPFAGMLVANTELVFSSLDMVSGPDSPYAMGYSIKLEGVNKNLRYSAGYINTLPEYAKPGGVIIRKDRDHYSLSSMAEFPAHSFKLDLSRILSSSYTPTLQKSSQQYEGALAYTYKGLLILPIGLEYRKHLNSSNASNSPGITNKSETDIVSGNIRYVSGFLDCGVLGKHRQKNDSIVQKKELTETFVSFSPRMSFEDFIVEPSLSMQRTNYLLAGLQTDTYSLNFGTKGKIQQKKVAYELTGGFKRTSTSPSEIIKNGLTSNLRISAPFLVFNSTFRFPSLELKGEYNKLVNPSNRRNDFSLFLTLDNG